MKDTHCILPRRDWRTDDERALVDYSFMSHYRADARRQMKVVAIVLVCLGSLVGGLLYHFLTQ